MSAAVAPMAGASHPTARSERTRLLVLMRLSVPPSRGEGMVFRVIGVRGGRRSGSWAVLPSPLLWERVGEGGASASVSDVGAGAPLPTLPHKGGGDGIGAFLPLVAVAEHVQGFGAEALRDAPMYEGV